MINASSHSPVRLSLTNWYLAADLASNSLHRCARDHCALSDTGQRTGCCLLLQCELAKRTAGFVTTSFVTSTWPGPPGSQADRSLRFVACRR
jgi:hypothetical protein